MPCRYRPDLEPDVHIPGPPQGGPPTESSGNNRLGLRALRHERLPGRGHHRAVAAGRPARLEDARAARGRGADAERAPLAPEHRVQVLRLRHDFRVRNRRRQGEEGRRRSQREQRGEFQQPPEGHGAEIAKGPGRGAVRPTQLQTGQYRV